MVIPLSTSLKYYKRADVQEAMIAAATNKEIAVLYGERGFGKRPDSINHPADILEFAKHGATSFHCSEELWSNPLAISTSMSKKDIEQLRIGWDLVLDIDCPVFEYSTIAADLIVDALRHGGIETISAKFSGNHGWHIAVPFEAFPKEVKGQPTSQLFPEGPKKIAFYLQEKIRAALSDKLLSIAPVDKIAKRVGKKMVDVVKGHENRVFDPFSIITIDTVFIAHRHLYRMPYSLNEKSGLVSIPFSPKKILFFEKESARPDLVVVKEGFLNRKAEAGEAKRLFLEALDFKPELTFVEKRPEQIQSIVFESAISEAHFPPCIKNILKGLPDGRKRSVFVLLNFLKNCKWDYGTIESLLYEWNKKNSTPLKEGLIRAQLNYHKRQNKTILPPNCKEFYQNFGVCTPDSFCSKIKNPVNYALLKAKLAKQVKKNF
ncbi:MAG: hypothetical protein QXU88_00875 [Candidatus Woesearchaeota archaeon]